MNEIDFFVAAFVKSPNRTGLYWKRGSHWTTGRVQCCVMQFSFSSEGSKKWARFWQTRPKSEMTALWVRSWYWQILELKGSRKCCGLFFCRGYLVWWVRCEFPGLLFSLKLCVSLCFRPKFSPVPHFSRAPWEQTCDHRWQSCQAPRAVEVSCALLLTCPRCQIKPIVT